MKNYRALSFFLFFLAIALNAYADDYPTGAGRKLGRGLSNAALGWTEILKGTERAADNHGPAAGVFWGPIDGLGNALHRTLAGVYETATFPIRNGSDNSPLTEPEFPIEVEKAGYRPKDYKF